MANAGKVKGVLVTGVIGEDVHVTGIRILEHALRSAGFKVVPLGVQVPQQDFINAAKETDADAILVSSLAGHASILMEGFRDKCVEAGLSSVLIYLGGMLVIGDAKWEDTEKMFKKMGVSRVYPPTVLPGEVISDLVVDIKGKVR
ncbi:MAG: methylaspartate mutase subunit S [Chloroflexi bacterium]|nr:methylaspartate mutase subunit S [Chloroflexota bacterium]